MEPKQGTSDSTKYVVGIIIIALVVIGVSFANRNKKAVNTEDTSANMEETEQTGLTPTTDERSAQENVVTPTNKITEVVYTDANGFTPDDVSIKVGDTVKFINKSSGEMWVGSDVHPTHEVYNGTTLKDHCPDTAGIAFDQCGTGYEYSFTFNKTGNWKYHNHTRATMGGIINVTE